MTGKIHTLKFSDQDMAVLDRALVVRPYAEVASLIASINQQINASSGLRDQAGSQDSQRENS